MALERLTQITEVGIQSGITLRNVNVQGAFVSGVVTATTLNVTGGGANFSGVVTATSFDGNVTGNITPTSLVVSGVSTFQASSFWGDGDVAYFGDGQDLLIFHNSTDSIIRDNGTGDLFIEGGNRIKVTNPTGIETYAVFNQDGASELWYDNVKKLETSGIGVTITSSLTVGTGASVSSPTANVLTLGTNDSERLRITSSGNVGIGTDNPSTSLHLLGSNTASRGQLSVAGSAGAGARVSLYQGSTFIGHISGDTTNGIFHSTESTYPIIFGAGGSERARITSTGNVQITNGNLVFSTSGTGIDFSANSNAAGMTSELLDDYEIGTWTPNQGSSLTVSGTFTSDGHYVKIGKLVMVQGRVGSSGGNISLSSTDGTITSNLPFQPIDRAPGNGLVENHSTGIHLMAADTRILSGGTFGSTPNFRFAVTYRTS